MTFEDSYWKVQTTAAAEHTPRSYTPPPLLFAYPLISCTGTNSDTRTRRGEPLRFQRNLISTGFGSCRMEQMAQIRQLIVDLRELAHGGRKLISESSSPGFQGWRLFTLYDLDPKEDEVEWKEKIGSGGGRKSISESSSPGFQGLRLFTLYDLNPKEDEVECKEKLGGGGFAVVFVQGIRLKDDQRKKQYAFKRISKDNPTFLRECYERNFSSDWIL